MLIVPLTTGFNTNLFYIYVLYIYTSHILDVH
jgi:hypothetical protein